MKEKFELDFWTGTDPVKKPKPFSMIDEAFVHDFKNAVAERLGPMPFKSARRRRSPHGR